MIEISFSPKFLRLLKKRSPDLIQEAREKIEMFRDEKNHTALKVHKLDGRLAGQWSFSVNYQTRILFVYLAPKEVFFVVIGDHDVYR